MKQYIKKMWKWLPPLFHEKILSLLCRIKLSPRYEGQKCRDNAKPIYVVGCFQAGGGLSRSAHLYACELRKNGFEVICVDSTQLALQTIKNPISDNSIASIDAVKNDLGCATVIFHHNPPQIQVIMCALGQSFLENKYVIAYWAWELENIPPLWIDAINYVDAIEVPSVFTQQSILKNTSKSVQVLPHKLTPPLHVKRTYCDDGKLACLFIMDMGSLRLRKNPEAIIHAFTQAFQPSEATLTIKLGQVDSFKDDYNIIKNIADGHSHVQILTHWMDNEAIEQLYLSHDVYISLHRSEGFGLTIKEAMMRNLYIVATGWSGNMDFMHGEKIFEVPYTLVPIEKTGTELDRVEHARWAEADINSTVKILRNVQKKLIPSTS